MKTSAKPKPFVPEEKKIKEEEYSDTAGLAPVKDERQPVISEEDEGTDQNQTGKPETNEDY